jgi:K+-sensing histidine kinase KdpD
MPDRADQAQWRVTSWRRISGPLVVLIAVLVLEAFRRSVETGPESTSVIAVVLLAVTLFASFQTGLRTGLLGAAIAILYAAYAFSTPGRPFRYAPGPEVTSILVVGPSLAAVALVVGVLRDRVNQILARERRVREKVEEVARWSGFLAESGRQLSSSLDYDETLETAITMAGSAPLVIT